MRNCPKFWSLSLIFSGASSSPSPVFILSPCPYLLSPSDITFLDGDLEVSASFHLLSLLWDHQQLPIPTSPHAALLLVISSPSRFFFSSCCVVIVEVAHAVSAIISISPSLISGPFPSVEWLLSPSPSHEADDHHQRTRQLQLLPLLQVVDVWISFIFLCCFPCCCKCGHGYCAVRLPFLCCPMSPLQQQAEQSPHHLSTSEILPLCNGQQFQVKLFRSHFCWLIWIGCFISWLIRLSIG